MCNLLPLSFCYYHKLNENFVIISPDSFVPFFPSGCCPASARQEGTTGSPLYRPHRILLTSERLPLIQYCWRREPRPDILLVYGFGGDLGTLGGKWLSETLTSAVRNPDLWRYARSYSQAHLGFLEKLEPTSTRVLSYSATNLLRQNRKNDGNESNGANTPQSCNMIFAMIRCCGLCIMCIMISEGEYCTCGVEYPQYLARCDAAISRWDIASPWEQQKVQAW